jgi:hypothetical protein
MNSHIHHLIINTNCNVFIIGWKKSFQRIVLNTMTMHPMKVQLEQISMIYLLMNMIYFRMKNYQIILKEPMLKLIESYHYLNRKFNEKYNTVIYY